MLNWFCKKKFVPVKQKETEVPPLTERNVRNYKLNCERLLRAKATNDERNVKLLTLYLRNRNVDIPDDRSIHNRIRDYEKWLSTRQ